MKRADFAGSFWVHIPIDRIPEITDLEQRSTAFVKKQILGLDVPICHSHTMEVVKCQNQLLEKPPEKNFH